MPTTGGSASLAAAQPLSDAFVVDKLRKAGAVILGKSNWIGQKVGQEMGQLSRNSSKNN
jgi:Asp-tRNA(Asn)/Glu-tRNA(Gln) amidotransferase A subunit family amidase